jgi:hypothetical protein
MNQRSATCARQRGRTGGRQRWSLDREEEGGRGRGAGADAYSFDKGHFWQWSTCWRRWLVYHHRRGGCQPGAFGQWSTCWWRWLVYPHQHCRSGKLRLSFFYIGFWRWRVGLTLFFLNWNLFPSNIIPHKHHKKIVEKYEQFIVGNLVFE